MHRRRIVAVVGVLLAAVLVLGTVDIFVWLPQHLAPEVPLDGIHAAIRASGDLPYILTWAVGWIVLWAVLGLCYVVTLLPAHRRLSPVVDEVPPSLAAALGCLLLGAAGFFHWFSAFSMGMSVADELLTSGGTTPFGALLFLGGLVIGAAGLVLLVIGAVSARARTAVA